MPDDDEPLPEDEPPLLLAHPASVAGEVLSLVPHARPTETITRAARGQMDVLTILVSFRASGGSRGPFRRCLLRTRDAPEAER
jgi:hypothetical protein